MKLKLTDKIQELIAAASKNPEFSAIYKEEASEIISPTRDPQKDYPISTDLIEYSAKLQGVYFHEIIIGSDLYFPPKEVKSRDPKFVAYLEKLRAEQQERDYNNMVSSVVTSEDQKFNLGIKPDEFKEIKSHIATIFNILFSMIAVYVAVYKASKTIVNDYGLQVLLALTGAFFIGIVEAILYSKYAIESTVEKKKTNKRNKKIATL